MRRLCGSNAFSQLEKSFSGFTPGGTEFTVVSGSMEQSQSTELSKFNWGDSVNEEILTPEEPVVLEQCRSSIASEELIEEVDKCGPLKE